MPNYNQKRRYYNPNMKHKGYRYLKYASKGVSVASKAVAAYAMARRLMDGTNIEYKRVSLDANLLPIQAGAIITLNSITQGDSDSQRDGDSLKLQNYTIRGSVGSSTSAVIRIIIFHDKQNVVSTPADLLEITATANAVFSSKLYDKRFQSKVLYDRTFNCEPGNQQRLFSKVLALNFHTQFNNGTTTINSGALKLCHISSSVATGPTLQFFSTLTFTDN